MLMQVIGFTMIGLSEYLFPLFSDRFHFDPYDYLAYGFGWLLFAILDNKPNRLIH